MVGGHVPGRTDVSTASLIAQLQGMSVAMNVLVVQVRPSTFECPLGVVFATVTGIRVQTLRHVVLVLETVNRRVAVETGTHFHPCSWNDALVELRTE